MRTSSEIKAEIEERLGFFPPFFEPAMDTPSILENLWRQTLAVYADNPLPATLKEKLFAYLSRFCGIPYCIVCHSCALRPLGLDAKQIFALLERASSDWVDECDRSLSSLEALEPMTSWEELSPELERIILAASITSYLEPNRVAPLIPHLRHVFPPGGFAHWAELMGYAKTCHLWVECHPELAYANDKRARENLAPLLEDEPRLGALFADYAQLTVRERENEKQKLRDERNRLRREIIERKQAEAALRESEERLRTIFETFPIGICIATFQGDILLANTCICRIFDYSLPELKQINARCLYQYSDDRGKVLRRFQEDGSVHNYEVSLKRKDGAFFPANLFMVPFWYGGKDCLLSVVEDFTERKQMEAQLRQSQKMEAVGQLTGGIAHDFNNILGIITGSLNLCQEIFAYDPVAKEYIEKALNGSMRASELVKDLLKFSRVDTEDRSLVSVNDLILELGELIAKSLMASIRVENHLSDDLWPVEIDPGDFENAILNLSLNARDAMPDGGALFIKTANAVLDEDYVQRNAVGRAGEFVMISVGDTGAGITEGVKEKMFEPFFSTKGKGKGTGLGLSMVFGFVKRSGGHINVYSEPNRGTTFRIYLPRASKQMDDAAAANGLEVADLPRGGETILIAEDEKQLADITAAHLESLGYLTITAYDGKQALEILQGTRDIDLLFSDVVMPGGVDGYELALGARKIRPGLKVFLTSGYSRKREEYAGGDDPFYSRLARNLLSKPYSKAELATAMRRALDEEAPHQAFEEKPPSDEIPRGDERLLLVEDNALVREGMVDMLQRLGYGIVEAKDGLSAAAVLEKDTSINLVITDLMMPGDMNGVDLKNNIDHRFPGMKLMFMTGHVDDVITNMFPIAGNSNVLRKPFTFQKLASAVRSALDE